MRLWRLQLWCFLAYGFLWVAMGIMHFVYHMAFLWHALGCFGYRFCFFAYGFLWHTFDVLAVVFRFYRFLWHVLVALGIINYVLLQVIQLWYFSTFQHTPYSFKFYFSMITVTTGLMLLSRQSKAESSYLYIMMKNIVWVFFQYLTTKIWSLINIQPWH